MRKTDSPSAPKYQGGRPKGFTLTDTDYAVLEKIADLGLQNYSQLRQGVLQGRHRVAVWSRMKRLVRAGLVRECRDDNGRILAWTITLNGASQVYVDPDAAQEAARLAPVYRSTFRHDRVLIEVREILSRSPVIIHWEPEAALRAEVMRKFHFLHPRDQNEKTTAIPDALLSLEANGAQAKAALELELTQKSRSRLYKKLEAHITNSEIDYVFYVTQDENLKQHLMNVYADVQSHSMRVKIAIERNGIYFTTLAELLENGLNANFEGTHITLSFAQMAA